jgi:hypothetical protein
MALVTPPSWLQNGTYPAESDRLTQQALYNTTGIIGTASLAVTQNSPVGMSVRVAAGWAAIIGTTQTNMGAYVAYNDATEVLTITAADPTNPRIDRVVATVRDAYYSGSDNDVIFQVIAGTPAGSPVAPTTPANSISLATIAVAAAATQIVTANITDTRVATTTNLIPKYLGQVVTGTASLNQTTTSTTFVDVTGMSATITPTSANSRILVNFSFQGGASGAANGVVTQAVFQLVRTSTGIYTVSPYIYSPTLSNELLVNNAINMQFVDSPATTSPITYKLQAREESGGSPTAVYISGTGVMILTEIIS